MSTIRDTFECTYNQIRNIFFKTLASVGLTQACSNYVAPLFYTSGFTIFIVVLTAFDCGFEL